jgi:hypothetical protein
MGDDNDYDMEMKFSSSGDNTMEIYEIEIQVLPGNNECIVWIKMVIIIEQSKSIYKVIAYFTDIFCLN